MGEMSDKFENICFDCENCCLEINGFCLFDIPPYIPSYHENKEDSVK